MAGDLELAVVALIRELHGSQTLPTPDWLQRPGSADAGRRWPLVQALYRELTHLELPEAMPARERRTVDCVLERRGEAPRIVEFDESQHFNCYRALTLRRYPRTARVAFDRRAWLKACDAKTRLEGGGFGKPKPPLFPHNDGRHRQRAYRDALADLLPAMHGWMPTLRIADFEVKEWIYDDAAADRMAGLLAARL